MEVFYEIAVDAPLASTLTYSQPAGRMEPIPAGCCVLVPLGRRMVTGYVLGLATDASRETPGYTIRPIAELLTDSPFFPAELIPFYRWIARYYHHCLGEVMKTALPLAPGGRSGRIVELTEKGKGELIRLKGEDSPPAGAPWLESLVASGRLESGTVRRLWRNRADRVLLEQLAGQELITIRQELTTTGARAKTRAVLSPLADLVPEKGNPSQAVDPAVLLTGAEAAAGQVLSRAEFAALLLLVEMFRASGCRPVARSLLIERKKSAGPKLNRLIDLGLVIVAQERVHRDPFGEQPDFHPSPEQLTAEQEQVLASLLPAIEADRFAPFLLHGVTGSGKTEVYLQAVDKSLAMGRTALVLVPEIALAVQLEAHFYTRFGDRLAMLHSGLSDGERFDQWQQVLDGRAKVVLGARSAVFAPLRDLGVIIVDEEHEPAYKQEDGLRYHGRDLAVLRAQQAGCPVLLGSATPSVVSYHHCREGKYTLLTMEKRVAEQPLPAVEIVDLSAGHRSRPDLTFSDALINALAETLEARRQSLLFVNRRGFSPFVLCRDCGHILQCRHCQVSLTLHRSRGQLLCHYCGYTLHPAVLCPACGSNRVSGQGIGSERIEEEVRQLFPQARIARLDSDTTVNRKHYLATLKAVRTGQIDILVGTQMIAKGLHFPGITLVGVVWADAGLGMPDYKAAERTFALLAQVTGRAGRGADPGRVIIQTYQPHHYSIVLAQAHDYRGLYRQEAAIRRPLGYPPFSRLVNIRLTGADEEQVQAAAGRCGRFLLDQPNSRQAEILGPTPAPLVKLRDQIRWQLLLKSRHPSVLHELCERLILARATLCPRSVHLSFDVDPENML